MCRPACPRWRMPAYSSDAGRVSAALDWMLPLRMAVCRLQGTSTCRALPTTGSGSHVLLLATASSRSTFPSPYLRHFPTRLVEPRSSDGDARPGAETVEFRVSYEEAFRNELRAFHAAVVAGHRPGRDAPSRSARRADVALLLERVRACRRTARRRPLTTGRASASIGALLERSRDGWRSRA